MDLINYQKPIYRFNKLITLLNNETRLLFLIFDKALKDKIRNIFPKQTYEYSCRFDCIDDSSGRPKVYFL